MKEQILKFKVLVNVEYPDLFGVFMGGEIWDSSIPQLMGSSTTMEDLLLLNRNYPKVLDQLKGYKLVRTELKSEDENLETL